MECPGGYSSSCLLWTHRLDQILGLQPQWTSSGQRQQRPHHTDMGCQRWSVSQGLAGSYCLGAQGGLQSRWTSSGQQRRGAHDTVVGGQHWSVPQGLTGSYGLGVSGG